MAVDVSNVVSRARSWSPPALGATTAIAAVVVLGFALRVTTSFLHSTPHLFPDEYIYAELSRALAGGALEIRGQAAAFPALLEPLLAAPLWALTDDVEVGYRLVQTMHALAAALAAVPVFVLARRLGISSPLAVACGALTVALPVMIYGAYVTADAVALPLALAALAAGVAALDRPTDKGQLVFLAFATLATLARIQYVVLPVAFIAGAAVVSRGPLRRTLREFRVTLAALILAAIAISMVGAPRLLGYYGDVTRLDIDFGALGYWSAVDTLLLVYAAGLAMVPAAFVGLGLALARPRSRVEHAFGAMTVALGTLLLAEAALYASNGSERFQERYLVALLPLVAPLFCLGMQRVGSRAVCAAMAGGASALFLVSAILPLAEFTVGDRKQDSPTLQALDMLLSRLGTGTGSLVIAVSAAFLTCVAAAAPLRPQIGIPSVLAATFAALSAMSIGSIEFDRLLSLRVERTFVASGRQSWVDDARLGAVEVLQTPFSSRMQISDQLFWNRSLVRILRMPKTDEVDKFGSVPTTVADDGRIIAAGSAVSRPLLVQEHGSWAHLEGARLVRRTVGTSLWRPTSTPRLVALFAGRYLDGWLTPESSLTLWPRADGPRRVTVSITVRLPHDAGATTLSLRAPGLSRALRLSPGAHETVEAAVTVEQPWTLVLRASSPNFLSDGRFAAAIASVPVLSERVEKE
jgi:hypothetical protein